MKEYTGKSSSVNIFSSSAIAEYRTKKAAEKFAKRVIKGATVKRQNGSAFGDFRDGVFYVVYEDG